MPCQREDLPFQSSVLPKMDFGASGDLKGLILEGTFSLLFVLDVSFFLFFIFTL